MRGIFPKSKTKKHIAGFFLGLVIFNLIASSATAFAQQQSYKDYEDLFKPASLTYSAPIVNQTAKALTGFKFVFKWDFEAAPEGEERDASWHWDHVASPSDIDSNKKKQFLVRFCNTDQATGAEIEDDKCFYSEVPYKSQPKANVSTYGGYGSTNTQTATDVYNATKTEVLYREIPSGSSGVVYTQRGSINITTNSFFAIDSADTESSYTLPTAFDGRRYHASLWYCAGNPGIDRNKSPKPPVGAELVTISAAASNIHKFGDLCEGDGRAYFKIAETPVFVAKTFDTATAEAAGSISANAEENAGQEATQSPLPSCHPLNGFGPGEGSVMGCVAVIAYFTLFKLAAFFAWLMGQLFDFFIGYSISDEAYRHDFIDTAWRLVRDICNIFFILILVYTGLMVVFQTNKYNLKNIVAAVIVNALIINFSLLVTRIGIDLSNVATRVFYNQVEIKRDGVVVSDSTSGYKPISEAIVSSFNPQRIFQNANLLSPHPSSTDKKDDGFSGQTGGDVSYDAANLEVDSQQLTRESGEYASYFLLVTIMAAAISLSIGLMFWKVSFMFLGRVVGLYVMMIFSPVAFLTRSDKGSLPLVGGIPKFGWKNWTSEYGKYLALAPIFVLYLYVLNSFFNLTMYSSLGFEDARTQSVFSAILYIVIPMLVVYGLIRVGVKLAENYAGEFGSEISKQVSGLVSGAAGVAGGAAIGVATGGLGLVGRQVGMAGRAIQQKTKFGDWAQRNQGRGGLSGGFAKFANKTFERSQNASFDPRNTALMGKFTGLVGKQMGINLKTDNAVTSALKLGSDKTKGGLNAYDKRRKEEDEKRVEDVKTSYRSKEDAQNNYNKVLAAEFAKGKENADVIKENLTALNDPKMRKLKEEAEKDLKQQLKDKVISSYSTADIDDLAKKKKKKWEDENPEFIKEFNKFKEDQSKKYGAVKDNDTLTQAMRLRYAEQVKNSPSTVWDYVRGVAMVNGPDISHKLGETEKNMEKYIEDKRKQITKETAANENLKKVNDDLNTILKEMAETHTEFEKFKTTGKYDHTKLGDEDRINMIKARRAALQTEMDLGTENLASLKKKFDETGDAVDKANYTAELLKRNEHKENLEALKGIVNRYEKAQEKVEAKSDKPKA